MPSLLQNIPADLPQEVFENLLVAGNLRIERILSKGQSSPASGWYDQDDHEWVLLMQGQARLEFSDGEVIQMHAGDWINIPAHRKHKVLWTTPDEVSVWLAIFYPASTSQSSHTLTIADK